MTHLREVHSIRFRMLRMRSLNRDFRRACLLVGTLVCAGSAKPVGGIHSGLGTPDIASRQAIHVAQLIGRRAGEKVWKGMAAAPFDVLLIEADRETLLVAGGDPYVSKVDSERPAAPTIE